MVLNWIIFISDTCFDFINLTNNPFMRVFFSSCVLRKNPHRVIKEKDVTGDLPAYPKPHVRSGKVMDGAGNEKVSILSSVL